MQRWLRTDVLCGLMFVGFAAWGFAAGAALDSGTASAMGPGYFPRLVSGLLLAFGLAIAGAGLLAEHAAKVGRSNLKPIALVSASALAFALLLQRAGIVLAIAAVVSIGSAAGREVRLLPLAALIAFLALACIGLFVLAIGIPLPIWPQL